MQHLRSIHLYLGCIFAPMLLVFAISGFCQTLGIHPHSQLLSMFSGIHKSILNSHDKTARVTLTIFSVMMAAAFIFTTVLGVVMAIKYGRSRRAVFYCLIFGVAFPVLVILYGHL